MDELGQMIQVEVQLIKLLLEVGLPLFKGAINDISDKIHAGNMDQMEFFRFCEGQYYIIQAPDGTLAKDGKRDPDQMPSTVPLVKEYLRQNGVPFTELTDLNPSNGVSEIAVSAQDVGILGKLLKEHGATVCERSGRPQDSWGLRALSIKDYLSTDKTYADFREEQKQARAAGMSEEASPEEISLPEGMPMPVGQDMMTGEELENEIVNGGNPLANKQGMPPLVSRGEKPEPVNVLAGTDKPVDVVKKEGSSKELAGGLPALQNVDLSVKPFSKLKDELGDRLVIDSVSIDEAKWVKGDGGKSYCEIPIPGKFINPKDPEDVGQIFLRLQPEQLLQATINGMEKFVFGFDKEQPEVAVCRYEKGGEAPVASDILPYLHLPKDEIPREFLNMTRETDNLRAIPEDIARDIAVPKVKIVPSFEEEKREFEQLASKLGIDTSKLNFTTDAEGKTLGNGKVAATRENIIENLADREDLPNYAMPEIPEYGAR